MIATYAQRRQEAACEAALLEALGGIRPEAFAALVGPILVARFGAASAEKMGEELSRFAWMAGRQG